MTVKSFEIDFKGEKKTVKYEDDISFGEIESVLKEAVDASNPTRPSINISKYRSLIIVKVLREAPFDFKTPQDIRGISYKVMRQVLDGISDDYALANFLEDWMTTVAGSQELKNLGLESMPSVPQNSDGTSKQSTDSQQDTSDIS